MKIKYEDIDKLSLSIKFIVDRQKRPSYVSSREIRKSRIIREGRVVREDYYLTRYKRRYDMFWIHVELGSQDLGYIYVDPEPGVLLGPATKFWLDNTGSKISYKSWPMIIRKVRTFFETSPEYQQQIEWVKRLRILIEWDKRELEEY